MKWHNASKCTPAHTEDLLLLVEDGGFYFGAYYHDGYESTQGGCTHLGDDDGDTSKVVRYWAYVKDIRKPLGWYIKRG